MKGNKFKMGLDLFRKIPIGGIISDLCHIAKANAGPISTGAVIIGMVTVFVLAAKAGNEAAEDIEEKKEELETDELTIGEKISATWKRFFPAVFILILTATCFVYTTKQMAKRYAVLSAAYSLRESYLKEYIAEAKQIAGPKKEQQIRDNANLKIAEKVPIERGIIETGYGDDLFFDEVITTKYFRSSLDHVKAMEKELSGIYESEDVLTMDDYTFRMGLGARANNGNNLGWKKSGEFDETRSFSLYYTSGINDRGEPYIIISQGPNRMTDLRK